MKRKNFISIFVTILVIFNVVLIINVTAKSGATGNIQEQNEENYQPTGNTYYCFYWADQFFIGPMTRHCTGCVEMPMTNPKAMLTCSTSIQE